MASQIEMMRSLRDTIVFDAKDYAQTPKDAWVWGIVCGWDPPSMAALQVKFRWSDATVSRLRDMRAAWVRTEWRLRKSRNSKDENK